MKVRLDFVTNSSSSSFIGLFGEVLDRKEIEKKIEEFKIAKYDFKFLTGAEILEKMNGKWFWGYGADWCGVELTPNKNNIKEDTLYCVFESYGGAGDDDCEFWNEEWEEYDYEVDYDDFNESDFVDSIRKFVDIKKEGCGAGRNG